MQSWHVAQSAPSDPQDPSPVLSLSLWASVTCLGPTRTFQNQQMVGEPPFGFWSPHLFWVKLDPASAHPCITEGETEAEAVDSQNLLSLHLPRSSP